MSQLLKDERMRFGRNKRKSDWYFDRYRSRIRRARRLMVGGQLQPRLETIHEEVSQVEMFAWNMRSGGNQKVDFIRTIQSHIIALNEPFQIWERDGYTTLGQRDPNLLRKSNNILLIKNSIGIAK